MSDLPDPPRGIVRLKYKTTTDGWNARYMREGVPFSKMFADSTYGSPEAALAAAIEWREQAEQLLPPLDRREYARIGRRNNQSGHIGVYRTPQHYRVDGTPVYYWVATWSPEPRKKKHRSFSVDKYGEEEAKRLAIKARKEAIENLDPNWPEGSFERKRSDQLAQDFTRDIFAFEGEEKYRIHRSKERAPAIRQEKIDAFLELHGDLFCEICEFSFEQHYGVLGRGLIEVHHLVPLAEMEPNHKTTLDELICICSNCHLTIHNGDPTKNLETLRFVFDAKTKPKARTRKRTKA